MSDTAIVIFGFIASFFGLVGMAYSHSVRQRHNLITGTPTTDIRTIDSEEQVELTGTISGSADGGEFVSSLGQTAETVFTEWKIEEWDESGDHGGWRTLAWGIESTPFYLDDGTDRVRVAAEDWDSADVICEWEDFPVVTEVGVDSAVPTHIKTFEDEHDLSEQSGSITNLVDIGTSHGDRRYSERALGPGDDIYLLGHIQAAEGETTPLHPEDAVVTTTDDDESILSDLSEDALIDRLGSKYWRSRAASALALVLGIGLIVAGTTSFL